MSKKNTHHVYTSTKPDSQAAQFRLANYALLVLLILVHRFWDIHFGEPIYFLVVGAIVGTDVKKILTVLKYK